MRDVVLRSSTQYCTVYIQYNIVYYYVEQHHAFQPVYFKWKVELANFRHDYPFSVDSSGHKKSNSAVNTLYS